LSKTCFVRTVIALFFSAQKVCEKIGDFFKSSCDFFREKFSKMKILIPEKSQKSLPRFLRFFRLKTDGVTAKNALSVFSRKNEANRSGAKALLGCFLIFLKNDRYFGS